jgi:hypothetical protein
MPPYGFIHFFFWILQGILNFTLLLFILIESINIFCHNRYIFKIISKPLDRCLHDTLRKKINRQQKNSQIWLYILQQQENCHIDGNSYTFEREAREFGWCVGLVQKYITICKPLVNYYGDTHIILNK